MKELDLLDFHFLYSFSQRFVVTIRAIQSPIMQTVYEAAGGLEGFETPADKLQASVASTT